MESCTMRQEQAAATKRKLLDSAQKTFAEMGYEGASVRMINRRANLADGLLYHYFPGGKKAIFQAVVRENMRQILEEIESRMTEEYSDRIPLEEILGQAYLHFIRLIERNLDILRILFRENEVRGFVTREEITRVCGSHDPWLARILRRKAELGEVREMDFEAAALSVNAILMNHAIIKVFGIGPSLIENEETRKRLIDYQLKLWLKEI